MINLFFLIPWAWELSATHQKEKYSLNLTVARMSILPATPFVFFVTVPSKSIKDACQWRRTVAWNPVPFLPRVFNLESWNKIIINKDNSEVTLPGLKCQPHYFFGHVILDVINEPLHWVWLIKMLKENTGQIYMCKTLGEASMKHKREREQEQAWRTF